MGGVGKEKIWEFIDENGRADEKKDDPGWAR